MTSVQPVPAEMFRQLFKLGVVEVNARMLDADIERRLIDLVVDIEYRTVQDII